MKCVINLQKENEDVEIVIGIDQETVDELTEIMEKLEISSDMMVIAMINSYILGNHFDGVLE